METNKAFMNLLPEWQTLNSKTGHRRGSNRQIISVQQDSVPVQTLKRPVRASQLRNDLSWTSKPKNPLSLTFLIYASQVLDTHYHIWSSEEQLWGGCLYFCVFKHLFFRLRSLPFVANSPRRQWTGDILTITAVCCISISSWCDEMWCQWYEDMGYDGQYWTPSTHGSCDVDHLMGKAFASEMHPQPASFHVYALSLSTSVLYILHAMRGFILARCTTD